MNIQIPNLSVAQVILLVIFTLVFVWMIIDQYYPHYRNYLIALWNFYIMKKFNKPINHRLYRELEQQLKDLKKEGVRKYEQNFVQMVLDHAGKIKVKTTGKHKNKLRWKFYHQGRKTTNFR